SVFFFQAEDGIRDDLVTGVQTCALPICRLRPPQLPRSFMTTSLRPLHHPTNGTANRRKATDRAWNRISRQRGAYRIRHRRYTARSEERRVGKECRYGWGPREARRREKQR